MGELVSIRWATWWPAPYWTDRFNHLAERDDVDFEAVFLSRRSSHLDLGPEAAPYKFRHFFLSQRSDEAGYYPDFAPRLPRPWPLVRGRFDGLVFPYSEASCIAAAGLCQALGKPYYLFAPNTTKDERKPSRLREWLKQRLFEGATGVLATGPAQREYAAQYAARTKISIIGNPVGRLGAERYSSDAARDDLRLKFGWGTSDVLLYVGRLGPEKGLTTLIKALGRISSACRPKLVMVGSGPLEDSLRAEAAHLGVGVEITGFLGREELALRYAAADALVLPSQSEAWGLVVNEAMEFRLPLILSDRVGCARVLLREGENGFVFPSGDAAALATRIERLASDLALRRRMGAVSKEIVRDNSVERWAEAVISAVREDALSRRGRR